MAEYYGNPRALKCMSLAHLQQYWHSSRQKDTSTWPSHLAAT